MGLRGKIAHLLLLQERHPFEQPCAAHGDLPASPLLQHGEGAPSVSWLAAQGLTISAVP